MKPQEAELEVLRQARELWRRSRCTDYPARDSQGRWVLATSTEAVSFCAIGAVCRVMSIDSRNYCDMPGIVKRMLNLGVLGANDYKDWAGVERIFDKVEEEVRRGW